MKLWLAPAGLHIEPATIPDTKALARMHGRAFFHGWQEAELTACITTPHKTPIYVACNAGRKLAGFMILRLAAEEAELLSIVVADKWRGKGIGGALLRAGFDDLLATPIKRMFLEVAEANGPALSLYKQFGFDEVGKREGYYSLKDGTPATALVMRATLG